MNLTDIEGWSLARLGYLYYGHERFEEAESIFAGLATIRPQDFYPWHVLGLIARRKKNHTQAIQYFQHALKLSPENIETRIALAETLYEGGQLKPALEMLQPFKNYKRPVTETVRRAQILLARWSS